MKECPKELIDAHWGYVSSLLVNHGVSVDDVCVVEFHYRSAFAHGWKHAKEDSENDKQPGERVEFAEKKGCVTCGYASDCLTVCGYTGECRGPLMAGWMPK